MRLKRLQTWHTVVVLVGIELNHAAIWQIFSQVAKQQQTIPLNADRKDLKALYSFHETSIISFQTRLKGRRKKYNCGFTAKNLFLPRIYSTTSKSSSFVALAKATSKASISQIAGYASSPYRSGNLTKTYIFKNLIEENATEETENLLEILEKRLSKTDKFVFFRYKRQKTSILNHRHLENPSRNT